MFELLKGVPEGNISHQLVRNSAAELAAGMMHRRKLIFDKTGLTEEPALRRVFGEMRDAGLRGEYRMPDGARILFYPIHLDDADLVNIDTTDSIKDRIDDLARFVAGVPAYVQKARGEVTKFEHRFLRPNLPEGASDFEVVRYLVEPHSDSDRRREPHFGWRDLREALLYFGNPRSYQRGNGPVVEAEPEYPTLVPIVNVQFRPESMPNPEDPLAPLEAFNQKFAPHASDVWNGRKKVSDVMTREELKYAAQCAGVVGLFESMTYNGHSFDIFSLPSTMSVIAAPMFPFEQIRRNYGEHGEHWNILLANDVLSDSYRAYTVEAI